MDREKVFLCSANDCTGCGACAASCAQNAISMHFDEEGFPRPQIDYNKCVGCKACVKNCPVNKSLKKEPDGIVYAAWALDSKIRRHSSSGGIFSVLAKKILSENGCVIGASLDNDTGFVNHIIIETEKDLPKLQGSKYVQSCIDVQVLKRMILELKNGRKVLFSGTPCQIAGVINLTKKYSDKLFTIDIVCHGVPSPTFFAKVHRDIKNSTKGFLSYNFRYLKSWSTCANVDYKKNGTIKNKPITGFFSFYLDAFLKGLMHRSNCYHCQYASIKRIGDITLADFWGIGKKRAIAGDVKEGCSMVSVNTEKGSALFNLIESEVFYEKREISETIDGGNEQLVKCSNKPDGRETFYKDAAVMGYKQLIKKYKLQLSYQRTLYRRLMNKIRDFLGCV